MIKATIEIDNNTASGLSPIEWIRKFIIKDATVEASITYDKKGRTVIYRNSYATITLRNIRQI